MRAPDDKPDIAMEILRSVAAAHDITISRIIGPCRRPRTSAARKAFCIQAAASEIAPKEIADILACDRTTVQYHISPVVRTNKKNARARAMRAEKARGSHVNAWCAMLAAQQSLEQE